MNHNHGAAEERIPKIPRPDPNRPKLRLIKPAPETPVAPVEKKMPPPLPRRAGAIRLVHQAPRPIEANPLATSAEVRDLERTRTEIETTEVDGFEHSSVVIGMKVGQEHVKEGRPSEDFAIVAPEHEVVGVADGIGATGGESDAEGLNPAARASRTLGATIADRFGDISKAMTIYQAERKLMGIKILDLDPNVSEPNDLPVSMDARKAAKTIDQLLTADSDAAKKAATLIAAIEEANEAVIKQSGGGQTTACIGVRHGEYLFIANVGDSRGFIQRPGEAMIPVTREDSLANYLLEVGTLTPEDLKKMRAEPDKENEVDLSAFGASRKVRMTYRRLVATPMGGLGNPEQPSLAIPTLTILKVTPDTVFVAATDGITDKMQRADGSFDIQTMQNRLGCRITGSDADNMTHLINDAAKRKTVAKTIDDDKTVVRMKMKK